MNGLLEILTNKYWMLHPDFLKAARPMIQNNLNGHIALTLKDKRIAARAYASTNFDIEERKVSAKDGSTIYSWRENANDPFINLMYVDGPITRNGDGCSYGSVEHRDMLMEAADNPLCIGHVFYINTPGGSAWAKNDYQQAIDYAHERGQKVYAFVDGMCCSAGMYLAALCDERYYMHPKDQIGCIGVMAAFYTIADGAHNQYDDTTYHEIYDPESFEKNKEIRDIANDGDDKLLVKELTELGVEFRADVKKTCPRATDEHLHGKVFDAANVTGILMDAQATLGDLFAKMIKDAAAAGSQAAQAAQRQTIFNNNNKPEINMKEKFPFIAALVDVEDMVLSEDGTHFDMDRLETLNAQIGALQKERDEAKKLVEQLQTQLTEKDAEHQSAIESLNQEHATAIEAKDKDIEAKDAEIATLTENAGKADEALKAKDEQIETLNGQMTEKQTAIDGAQAALATAEQTIAERDQQISDLNARIAELENDPGQEPQAGASPENNGEGAQAATIAIDRYAYDNSLSYEENMKRKAEFEKAQKA